MRAERKARLESAGVDVEQALERMMGSDALLERLLRKFLEDGNFTALTAALEAGDLPAAVNASHTLKGVCGNLSMTGLYLLFTRQVEALRAGELAQARALMEEIASGYQAVTAAIGEDGNGAG